MITDSEPSALVRARQLATYFALLPQVTAVALGGSLSSGTADSGSDIDLYIYIRDALSIEERKAIVARAGGASQSDLGLSYWGPGDLWIDATSGILIDCNYFEASWMQAQMERLLDEHVPSLGYTTCFWRTIQQSSMLYDAHGWFRALQERSQAAYPEELRHNIISYNHPVLRGILTSYYYQIESAVKRQDLVSVNHRLAALLASYFDIVFALNRVLHPGEKRQVAFALSQCQQLPEHMQADLTALLRAAGTANAELLSHLGRLLDHLDDVLREAGYSSI